MNNKKVSFIFSSIMFACSFVNILPVSAQKQSICQGKRSNMEYKECVRAEYKKSDRELNLVWKQVISQMSGDAKERLIDRQLAWIENRDTACDRETQDNRRGSGYRAFLNLCLRRVTIERTEFLRDYLR